jgi:radical SAM superfamily enzyme YgiQ (UPF0313 family)
MKRVGIYVFTDMVKQRLTKKRESFFDGQNYIGLRYIVSQINTDKYEITYVSKDTINTVDFVLISLTSYYDILNLINELHGVKCTCKIIVGGAGLSNVDILRDVVDVAIVGRGENIINEILDGQVEVPGIWYRQTNYDLKSKIKIRELEDYITIPDPILGQYCEQSIGCQRKCYFCEYSWKNRYKSKSDIYHSGLADRETRLEEVDWTIYKNKDLVTAVDGIDEKTRKIINKPITNETIINKINEIYEQPKDYLSLKLYCLLGYPFEKDFYPEELLDAITSCRRDHKNRLNVVMVSPHFMPMPFTPMECEPVNPINFRNKIKKYDFRRYQTGNIKVFWPWSLASGPINALEATVLHRGTKDDAPAIKKILCSSKYKSLAADEKNDVLYKAFGNLLGRVEGVCDYIERTYPTAAAKKKYQSMVAKLV